MPTPSPRVRSLAEPIFHLAFQRNKIALLAGPRQVGKTTLAQGFANDFDSLLYRNWDDDETKRAWTKKPASLFEEWDLARTGSDRLLVLDEIHKSKGWKGKLKGIYDLHRDDFRILVTGSARLNVYRRGSDSLLGRTQHFRLHPFSLRELLEEKPASPEEFEMQILKPKADASEILLPSPHLPWSALERLFRFSGFPEPLFEQNPKTHRLWKKDRREKIIREDLRDLTRIQEISLVEALVTLLPEKIGSPLSIQSLREDLSVAHDTVTRWLLSLKELYHHFDVLPHSKSIARSIKKEPKLYFYDWTDCESDGARFENMVASHLLKACHYWEDTGEGEFELRYLRDKEKREVDFVMIRDGSPWFTAECKLSETRLDPAYRKFQDQLGVPHLQVVFQPDIHRRIDAKTRIISADHLLGALV